jgi:hypothetical protein
MVFAVAGGGQLDTGYTIDNSLRFNQSDDPSLKRTPASVSNRRTFTWSGWVKRSADFVTRQLLFGADNSADSNASYIRFTDDESIQIYLDNNNSTGGQLITNVLFRDVSAWYHIVWVVDTTNATADDRIKLYVNGIQVTSFSNRTNPSLNFNTNINTQEPHYVGGDTTGVANDFALDGYMAEVHFIDGTAKSPTDFGEFDEDSGIWKPKEYSGSYGTNGFYLDFENSGSLGADQSGNGNNFTPTNLASTDQMQDTPTNNFCTMNQLHRRGTVTFAQGNLRINLSSSSSVAGTHSVNSGKWYFEAKLQSGSETMIGWINPDISTFYTGNTFEQAGNVLYYSGNGNLYKYGGSSGYGASYSAGTIIGCALDLDNNQVTFYKNGVSQGAASINAGNYIPYLIAGGNSSNWSMCFSSYDFSVASGNSDANGYGNFEYAPPSGYLAWCTQNIATELSPTIDDGSQYFDTALHTGNNGSGRTFTGLNFQPDWIWGKVRNSSNYTPFSVDSSRGGDKFLTTSSSASEDPGSHGKVSSFNSDGTTWIDGSNATYPRLHYNDGSGSALGGSTYVFWQWKANGGSTSSNTNGSITSTVQANPTAGFSIVLYTGTGSNATIGHGLGVAPKMIICKQRNNTLAHDWMVYHEGIGNTKYLNLNQTNAPGTASTVWQNTTPTSSVFSVGTAGSVNQSGKNQLAYCFADIEGYSAFGKYTGNGSNDGAFVYTGFSPAFTLIKRTNSTGEWAMHDNARNPSNVVDKYLWANKPDAEGISNIYDRCANGFKLRGTSTSWNASGSTYIYMAFAENPFVSSTAIPVTAR